MKEALYTSSNQALNFVKEHPYKAAIIMSTGVALGCIAYNPSLASGVTLKAMSLFQKSIKPANP